MIGVLLAVLLVSPQALYREALHSDECTGQLICPYTETGRVCYCAPPIISLGLWDPRPEPAQWPHDQ